MSRRKDFETVALSQDERALVSRGYALTATDEAMAGRETESELQNEMFRYERAVLDLQSEFATRRDVLDRVTEITGGGE